MSSYTNKIAIVGCGLLGSMLAPPFSAYAVSLDVGVQVTLIDYDIVEKRNSPSNLGVPTFIGAHKIDVVAEVYKEAGIPVKSKNTRITEKNLWLLDKHSLIIGALDNVGARQLLLRASQDYGIPYIDLGLSFVGGSVTWSNGTLVTMPFAGKIGDDYKIPDDKKPACELVGTRVFSAIAVECAVISTFVYISGHDPTSVVMSSIGRPAKSGDMMNWHIAIGEGKITTYAQFAGTTGEDQ